MYDMDSNGAWTSTGLSCVGSPCIVSDTPYDTTYLRIDSNALPNGVVPYSWVIVMHTSIDSLGILSKEAVVIYPSNGTGGCNKHTGLTTGKYDLCIASKSNVAAFIADPGTTDLTKTSSTYYWYHVKACGVHCADGDQREKVRDVTVYYTTKQTDSKPTKQRYAFAKGKGQVEVGPPQ